MGLEALMSIGSATTHSAKSKTSFAILVRESEDMEVVMKMGKVYQDIFTTGLPSSLFDEFRDSLSVRCTPAPTAEEY
nr:ribonuclease H-like domain-containing protein [Tanacetum cinerariifolium]